MVTVQRSDETFLLILKKTRRKETKGGGRGGGRTWYGSTISFI